MRLWHYKLIPVLSNTRLLGQHRECCALRGKGWGRAHSTVNYVFTHNYLTLYTYHKLILNEMTHRKMCIKNIDWYAFNYRGKLMQFQHKPPNPDATHHSIFPEHNTKMYTHDCTDLIERGDWERPHTYFSSSERHTTYLEGEKL